MRRLSSLLLLLSFLTQLVPLTAHAEWAYYLVSAYYSPLPDQEFYLNGSYENEIKMNGEGKFTASGQAVRIGVVAAPRENPFNTRVRIKQTLTIKGTNVNFDFNGTILDRGGAINSANKLPRLDIYMWSGKEGLCRAINFGVQTVYVDFDTNSTPSDTTNFDNIPSDCSNPHNETVPLASWGSNTRPFDPFTMPIGTGSPVENIKIVQNLLSRVNAYSGTIDWLYNETLTNAIFVFQKANGIVQEKTDDGAGTYGPKTRNMLKALLSGQLNKNDNTNITNSTLNTNTVSSPTTIPTNTIGTAEDTRELQKKLQDLGYFKFEPDGVYNKRLVDAIYAFQLEKKIVTGVDDPGAGYYGSVTNSTLTEATLAFEAKKAQILALETKLDTAKQTREGIYTKKRQEYIETVKKIPTVKLNGVHSGIRILQKILKEVGYFDRKDTAIFGTVTKTALTKYQIDLKVIDTATSTSAWVMWDKTREAIAADLFARWAKTDITSSVEVNKIQKELDELKKN